VLPDFQSVPVHVAILDKGQRSVKGLNSGSEGVVTGDLVVTLQEPSNAARARIESELVQGGRSSGDHAQSKPRLEKLRGAR
jgi:hypothetical protein